MPGDILSAGSTTVKNTGKNPSLKNKTKQKNPSLRGLTLKIPAEDPQGMFCEAGNGGDRGTL